MKRWEYLIQGEHQDDDLESELCKRGDEGWELVSVCSDRLGTYWYFKRPKQLEADS